MKHNGQRGRLAPASGGDDLSDALAALCARDRSPSSPVALLDGMCRLATDMLGCDCTHSVLLQPEQESCVVAATYGGGIAPPVIGPVNSFEAALIITMLGYGLGRMVDPIWGGRPG